MLRENFNTRDLLSPLLKVLAVIGIGALAFFYPITMVFFIGAVALGMLPFSKMKQHHLQRTERY